jgi:hypothetical protein
VARLPKNAKSRYDRAMTEARGPHEGTVARLRKFCREVVQELAREPQACSSSPRPPAVPECPGCRAQRIAAGKTIAEWYDDGISRR